LLQEELDGRINGRGQQVNGSIDEWILD